MDDYSKLSTIEFLIKEGAQIVLDHPSGKFYIAMDEQQQIKYEGRLIEIGGVKVSVAAMIQLLQTSERVGIKIKEIERRITHAKELKQEKALEKKRILAKKKALDESIYGRIADNYQAKKDFTSILSRLFEE